MNPIELVFWILILGILWRVPEYKFLIFFILANNAFYLFVMSPGLAAMPPAQLRDYLIFVGESDLVFAAIAVPFIAFRKWQRTSKSGAERRADALVAAARGESRN